ncbi:MAG: polyprenyl synthetase family protein [Acetivibrio sp.]
MNFKIELEQRESEVESAIKKYLPIEEGYQKRVIEAMNYSLLSGGKRLRPILMKESFELFRGKETTVLEPFMAALEMIHTYSLVHDDLPAMDNDDYRRGRKTTHVVYGEAMGILAGDGLLNFAFETACKAFERADNKETVAESLGILSQKAGIHGMIGGQVVDVASQGKELSLEEITFIYRLKTSALIQSAMMIGAVLGGAEKAEVNLMEKAAEMIGLAFQIQDDILDITSTDEVLGKPTHSDEKNNKMTYVKKIGLEKAQEQVELYSKGALDLIRTIEEKTGQKNEFLKELVIYLIKREK